MEEGTTEIKASRVPKIDKIMIDEKKKLIKDYSSASFN